ncbi:MAG: hypothetical protein ACOY3K_02215 [Candidatus Omnitrophota bacterium]
MTKCFYLVLMALIFCSAISCSPKAQEPSGPQATVGLDERTYPIAFAELLKTTKNWNSLPASDKVRVVDDVIKLFQERDNVAVLKGAEYYAQRLDEASATGNFPMQLPLPSLLQILAVMEFDYYNGQNRDDYAKKLLGDKLYQIAKLRREQAAAQ